MTGRSRVAAPDLGDAFGQTPVPPPRPQPRPPVPAATVAVEGRGEAHRPAQPAARVQPSTARRRARKGRRRPAEEDNISVYVSVSLRERLRAFRRDTGLAYTTIALDAIVAVKDHLGERVEVTEGRREDGLFAGRTPRRLTHVEGQLQLTLRPSPNDLAVIDALVDEHGAISRSLLIARALDRHLP